MSFRIKDQGRSRESTDTTNRKLAERIHAKRLTEITEGRFFNKAAEPKARTLRELIERYRLEVLPGQKYPARVKSALSHVEDFFGLNSSMERVTEKAGGYELHRTREGAAPATVAKELGLLRRIGNIAIKRWRWITNNPVRFVEMPKVSNARVRYLNPEEVAKLQQALPSWLRPLVVIARHTGLRRGNLLALTWEQVDARNRRLLIPETKNGEPLSMPLTDTALRTLTELGRLRRLACPWVFCSASGKHYSGEQVTMAFGRASKKAGLTNFRFHDLRHDFASALAQGNVDLNRIRALLGHKDLRMTLRYAHLSTASLHEAVRVLDGNSGHVLDTPEAAEKKGVS